MKYIIKLLLFVVLFCSLDTAQAKFNVLSTDNETETLILFDSSGSMSTKLQNKTRIEHAADAVFNILQRMPDDEKVGLRTIGVHPSKIPSLVKAGRAEICKQTYLHTPIRKYNEQQVINSLKDLYPFGPTPLAYALKLVVENDFQHYTANKHIILITDGYESCGGNPCEYIKYLMTERNDITIDVIAIGANKYDLSYLSCLTDTTGGRIYDVQRPTEIMPTIEQITKKSLPNVQPKESSKPIQTHKTQSYENPPNIKKRNIQYRNYLLEFYD